MSTTPNPVYSFDTGTGTEQISIGGSPADANVAASNTHICVTARAAFACYTKSGTLVSPGPGFLARPYTAQEFFTQSGITIGPVPSGTPTKDGRVVFDQYRKRFFIAFQTREEHPHLLIAASKSEDPRDGWWTYSDDTQTTDVNGQDYMRIGINASHFLISNEMSKCTGTYPTAWNCQFVRTRHLMYTAGDLAAGKPYSRSEWSHVNANSAAPCVHDSYTTDAFWVHRDDDTHVSVWAVRAGQVTSRQVTVQPSTSAVNGPQLGGTQVSYTNIGRAPQNAQYRDGRIVFVSNDGHTWSGQSTPNNAVRLVRLNVTKYFDPSPSVTVELDRIFGHASAGDPTGVIFDYGWSAVAAGANGALVVGSVRSNATIYPELRASVWEPWESDISSSTLLRASSSPLTQFHMAGAAADPSTNGVYLAQQYGSSSPSWRIHVVKMLGEVKPDLIAPQLQAPATIARGVPGHVTVTVMNQGDGSIGVTQGKLYLSIDNIINPLSPSDTLLATFAVPILSPDQVTTLVVPFTIAATQRPGNYFVGVQLDAVQGISEYSEANNLNPFQAGNHGNAPMIVT